MRHFVLKVLLCLWGLQGAVCMANLYYVDSVGGDDLRSGTSEASAWQSLEKASSITYAPGDQILLKSSSVWNGEQLWPKGSGSAGRPIIIDRYGEGPAPLLNGDGLVQDVIYLQDQEYWEIRSLEITNYREGDDQWDDSNIKRGVYVTARDVGVVHHIYIQGLVIHDINAVLGPNQFPSKNTGGIFFEVTGNTVETWYDDFRIEDCFIYNVDRGGISNLSSWSNRTLTEEIAWAPSVNVVIRNNVFQNVGGNGLITRAAAAPLVEHNLFCYCGLKLSGNAMFFSFCDDPVGQYNEAYEEVYEPGETDAAGFDIDIKNKRAIFQYNYSHDNGQGAFVICTGTGDPVSDFQLDPILRYNICENNDRRTIYISGQITGARLYNNTFYLGPHLTDNLILWHRTKTPQPTDDTRYYNNILYNLSQNGVYQFETSTNNVFDYNVFYGNHPVSEPFDSHKITSDPLFVRPGSGGTGLDTVDGYQLEAGSPAIDSGTQWVGHPVADYWGNPVPYNGIVDRGAFEFSPQISTLPPPWENADIGLTGPVGGAQYATAVFSLKGGGADIADPADGFHYVYQPWSGEAEILARVVGVENTHAEAKAGLMIRESLDDDAKYAMVFVTPGGEVSWQSRQAGSSTATLVLFADGFEDGFAAAGWETDSYLSVIAYEGAHSAKMNNEEYVQKSLSTVGHPNIIVRYVCQTQDFESDKHFVTEWYDGAAWHTLEDLTGTFTWVHKEFSLPVAAGNNPDFRLRFRIYNTVYEDLAFVDNVEILAWSELETETVSGTASSISIPCWLKITRSGDTFCGFTSQDGLVWTLLDTSELELPTEVLVGLAVSAHDADTLCDARFDNVEVRGGDSSIGDGIWRLF